MSTLLVCEQKPPYAHLHDSGYKHLLQNKTIFLQFLRRFANFPWLDSICDLQVMSVNPETINREFIKMTADLMYRLEDSSFQRYYMIIIELQSTVDTSIGIRFFEQMMEQWRKEINDPMELVPKATEIPMPMIVPIVLYNGKASWEHRPIIRLDLFQSNLKKPLTVNLEYLFVDVQRLENADLFPLADAISSAFYLDQALKMNLENAFVRLREIAESMHLFKDDEHKLFLEWLNVMIPARISSRSNELSNIIMNTVKGDEAKMAQNAENVWAKYIDEVKQASIQQGITQGIEEGMIQGKQAGKLEGKKELALQLLKSGAVDIQTISNASGISEDEIRTWLQ